MPLKIFQREAILLGICLMGFQVLMACLSAPSTNFSEAYFSLCQWDCGWYLEIARDGYHSTIPPVRQNSSLSNVAFFPAYPYLGRALYLALGIQPHLGLLLLAQFFCVIFWAALWTLLRAWRIPRGGAVLVVLALLSHPAIFFLVSGYSESLFLSTLLLFILNSTSSVPTLRLTSAFAGFAMSSARIIGIPTSIYPVIHQVSKRWSGQKSLQLKELMTPSLVSLSAVMGGLIFLLFCQIQFGQFNLYMETQRIGWGIVPDYSAILKWKSFQYFFPIDGLATQISGISFLILFEIEIIFLLFKRSAGFTKRLPLYVSAFLIFFITLSGLKSVKFLSMIRYSLPWTILLMICVAHFFRRLPKVPKPIAYSGYLLILLGLSILIYRYQFPHLREFLRGQWFA